MQIQGPSEFSVADYLTWRGLTADAATGSESHPLAQLVTSREQLDHRIDFTQLFGNAAPLHVDIGCGKGRILVAQPLGPSVNYIGIERHVKSLLFCANRLLKLGVKNVRLLEGQAEEILQRCFADQSVYRFSILFPDPWHKRRHQRRRLIQTSLLQQLHRLLCKDGIVWIATDHHAYFEVMQSCFDASPLFVKELTDLPPPALTHFEIKYTEQARPIYRTAYRRLGQT